MMKCPECQQVEMQSVPRDLPYEYKGQTKLICKLRMLRCLGCGAEFIAPKYIPRWISQMVLFRASVDARDIAPGVPDHAELKDAIITEWLDFNPDQLAADVPAQIFRRERFQRDGKIEVVDIPYVSWQALRAYNEQVCQAFDWYKGEHATDVPGHVYLSDWYEFLADLRKARMIASDADWKPCANRVVYPPNRRN